MSGVPMDSGKMVKLAERRIFSQSFKPLYNEGMSLVEQAAEYLDGKGAPRPRNCRGSPPRSMPPNRCGSPRVSCRSRHGCFCSVPPIPAR